LPARSRTKPPERIGVFGGTFDPPHLGHLAAARAVQQSLSLDRLLLVVANDPWQKSPTRQVTPAEDRFAMTEALAEELPGAEASRKEIDRGGPSYTVETVEELRAEAESAGRLPPEIFLVVGADLVPELGTWERSEELRGLVTLAVVARPPVPPAGGQLPPSTLTAPWGWRVVRVDSPPVDVSSSSVRDVLDQGGPVDQMVPPAVIRCMGRRNLYAVGR
jgi:nicotinate-nucleotide adenylyltransferase